MALTIGSNIASLLAQRQLGKTDNALSQVFERLSSGQRINSASDDAAGLAIAESLSADARIASQGIRNLNDGLSLLNIADAALENLSSITTRLQELATQAANGVYGKEQRAALDAEAQALSDEFFRITKTTEFNGQKLFTGELSNFSLQAGAGENAILNIDIGGAIGTGDFDALSDFQVNDIANFDTDFVDLNGDGFLDLVATGQQSGGTSGISIHLGDGTGSFSVFQTYESSLVIGFSTAVGDINGDGYMDLATAGRTTAGKGYLNVRLGNGDGTFSEIRSYAQDEDTRDVALADFNGDGFLDSVTAGFESGDGIAYVRFGDSTGSLSEAVTYVSELGQSLAVTVGDVNNDGNADFITAGRYGPGYTTVFLGNGDGTFSQAGSYNVGGNWAFDVQVADLNGDGNLDLATIGDDGSNAFANILLGDGTGSFGAPISIGLSSDAGLAFQFGDLNGDGIQDLVASTRYSGDGFVTLLLGDGEGSFDSLKSFATGTGAFFGAALGDVNGDGVLDFSTGSSVSGTGHAFVFTGETVSGTAPLLEFSLATIADAKQALPIFERKLEQLAAQRGQIGASMSRIQVASNVLGSTVENFRAAESRIRDADIAEESSKLIRLQILQQASAAILAQANQQPALAIRLLGGE